MIYYIPFCPKNIWHLVYHSFHFVKYNQVL
nr:MAG TPA: hypothetical protein [Caudoviricetes sp.]